MNLIKGMKVLMTAALSVMVLSALVASASASVVPAKFSSPFIRATTTGVTVKRSGLEPTTCTLSVPIEGFAEGSSFLGSNSSETGGTRFTCPSPKILTMRFVGGASYDNVAKTYSATLEAYGTSLVSPWGGYYQQKFTGTWVNGSSGSPSTLTFNNATIGYGFDGKPLTLQGSLKMTTSTGGLLTLSP